MKIEFLRHATFILDVAGIKFLVDPMLSEKGAMDPVKIGRNDNRIPLVDLPISENELKKKLSTIDAVIVTHLHRDHWDMKAQQLIDKKTTLICQSSDVETLRQQGFTALLPVDNSINFKGLKINRTKGQHGTGEIGIKMGHVSGFVIEYENEKLYIAGDTIWCEEVEQALEKHRPHHIVLNAGAAQFDEGGPITMTAEDVIAVMDAARASRIIIVHMEAVNHCTLTRADLKNKLESMQRGHRGFIPSDGDRIHLQL